MKANKLASNIKKYRNLQKFRSRFLYAKYEKGLSAKKLAAMMNLSTGYISEILCGKKAPQETLDRAIAIVTKYPRKGQGEKP